MDHPLVASPMTRRESPKPPFSTPKRGRTSKNSSSLSPQNGSQMRLNFQGSNKGKGGSLPPSPVDETVLFSHDVDSDEEEEEEENEVFEDAGTPFVEDENNENLQPPLNNIPRLVGSVGDFATAGV